MQGTRGLWLSAVVALGSGCSPYGGGAFTCTSDTQCSSDGVCRDGFCAFPDPSCMSGYKYGEHSGPQSNSCVGDGDPNIDASVDADMTGTPDGAVCYGMGIVRPCFAMAPTGNTVLDAAIDTDGSMCAPLVGPNANAWCVLAGATISVQNTVAVTGSRPLVLVSTGVINISGTLDVASHRGGAIGPGADAQGCNAGTAPTVTSGGAGGSFGGTGGTGAATGTNGTSGMPGQALTVTALRGGCPGQKGAGTGGGAAGHGGGAVYLIAGTSITVGGTINASGSSGINADAGQLAGGGGGGAGGFIGLEAASVTITGTGQVFANGGAGGEGSNTQRTGNPGTDSPSATTAAVGGNGGSGFASDGGNGSQGATLVGANGSTVCSTPCTTVPTSGGGGGGGAGIIKVVPTQSTAGQLSPPAT